VKKNQGFREELIGCEIKVISSKNMATMGICGKVVDETKSTLLIDTPDGERRLIKSVSEFEITRNSNHARVAGQALVGTLAERLRN
jgi:ribonuclease P protein subunit POP4